MLFVSIGKAKAASTTKQRVARRVNWKYPAGMRVIGEYWLQGNDPTLITIVETESVAPIMSGPSMWSEISYCLSKYQAKRKHICSEPHRWHCHIISMKF
jgi:hypothetical protein